MPNYVPYHLHSDISNSSTPDSTSDFQDYIDLCVKHEIKSLAFSEHGSVAEWIKKKQAMDEAGIKYIHGMEGYLTTTLEEKLNETYHIGLYARNWEGVKELNKLSSKSYKKSDNHFYFKPRISMDELFNTTDNIIITTACLGSILWQRRKDEELINKILKWIGENNERVFFEIQYHNHPEQVEYNQMLYRWSQALNVKLIAGTDTHSSSKYDAECRSILQKAKNMSYGDEDSFDLVFKTYDELVDMFEIQNSLPRQVYMEAIENTNYFADMIEEFDLDYSFKYPDLYDDDEKAFMDAVRQKYKEKIDNGVIDKNDKRYKSHIQEEFRAFKKLGMLSFMTFMSELTTWCWENGIPMGFNRGSVGGSTCAYIMDIIDVDPIKWNTIFSRFCNEDRISLGDIDLDFDPLQREKVYEYIQNRFPENQTSYIITFNTVADKGAIDEIGRALKVSLDQVAQIKKEYETNPEDTKKKYPDIFYYFDGLKGTIISKGMHPAGMIASPIPLHTNIGFIYDEELPISQCSMKAVDSLNYVKFDILGLKNISIIRETMRLLNKPYPKSHEINWNDKKVWEDMITSPVGLFQFEANYAFGMLKEFQPRQVNDMSIVNAAIRPSGASYRDNLMKKKFHQNPSKEIDELLKDNLGYLIFQEDTIKFLNEICGFTGAEADSIRRYISKKETDKLNKALPKILKGYCDNSPKPKEVAEEEAKEFIRILQDSADYQFGFNHSTGYSMIGYLCAYLRYYHPLEFITAFLNTAANEDDIRMGTELAKQKGIKIFPIEYGKSLGSYNPDKENNSIYKGISSIKHLNDKAAQELYDLSNNKTYEKNQFVSFCKDVIDNLSVNTRQMKILIELGFFDCFGSSDVLMEVYQVMIDDKKANFELYPDFADKEVENNKGEKKFKKIPLKYSPSLKDDTKNKRISHLQEYERQVRENPPNNIGIVDRIMSEKEYLGYASYTDNRNPSEAIVVNINSKFTPIISLYQISSSKEITVKVKKKTFFDNGELLKVGDHIEVLGTFQDYKWRRDEDGKFYQDDKEKELFVSKVRHIK